MRPIAFTVPGSPPRKNRRTRTRVVTPKGGKPFVQYYPSAEWRDWVERLALAVGGLPRINGGAWLVVVRTYSNTMRHLDDKRLHLPHGDSDGSLPCVLDGLQQVRLLDDDARVVSSIATKHYDKANPRTEVELKPWEGA
jgi:hypothetical protein